MNPTLLRLTGALLFLSIASGAAYLLWPQPVEIPAPIVETQPEEPRVRVVGRSFEGRDIELHSFGSGEKDVLFVGGIHGGYEWNSVVLAYEMIDYLAQNEDSIPSGVSVHIMPNANPDGVFAVVGKEGRIGLDDAPQGDASAGRFNARGVDLNRNFACKWQPYSTWRSQRVSAGAEPFSEPESQTIRDVVRELQPAAAIFWHSQADAVYASECHGGILPETREIMDAYADAAGYKKIDTFDAYPVTGDVEGWLASIGIPAITVELSSHDSIERDENLAGLQAILEMLGR